MHLYPPFLFLQLPTPEASGELSPNAFGPDSFVVCFLVARWRYEIVNLPFLQLMFRAVLPEQLALPRLAREIRPRPQVLQALLHSRPPLQESPPLQAQP